MDNSEITSANKLFDRVPQESYKEEWTKLLAQPPEKQVDSKETSIVVFRVEREWFGLSALVFAEIGIQRTINLIPYPNDPIILGVVNMQGQLRLCFSFHALLGLEKPQEERHEKVLSKAYHPCLLAITDGNELFTFPVEDVDGVYQFNLTKMTNVPVNVLNSKENYLKGVLKWNEKTIYVINENMLFRILRGKMA